MVEIEVIEEPKEPKETKEMKLEDILNDIFKKIEVMQSTIGYILTESNLIPKK